jgi:uncharacterized protein YydD (DUF2326 family)
MIHSVTANRSSFHPVQFTPGLNVIVAERTDASTQKDTRNGLGKSTLIDIIDFCLGARVIKGKGLSIEPLEGWEFTLEMTIAKKRVEVSRAVDKPSRIIVLGDTTGWKDRPDIDEETGELFYNWDRWRAFLGCALYGLPLHKDNKYYPAFRSLISYFIRRGLDAFVDPFRHTRQQQPWDVQVHVGYLLGLNWQNASRWQNLKDKEKGIKAINQAMKTGVMDDAWGNVGELETERVQLEDRIEREAGSLQNFKVHPQYEAVQTDADETTANIHNLTNANIAERRRLARYRDSVKGEKPPSAAAINELYRESGVVFPDSVRRTLLEAKEFHAKIVENRKFFLESEIARLERSIEYRDRQIRELTEARAMSLAILSTHGALKEMTMMQERLVEARGKLDRVQARITEIKELKSRKRELGIAKVELARVAEQDHEQRREIWAIPLRIFNDNSQSLYKIPGRLVIDIGEAGFRYDVEIDRSGSEGVGKMKVFCFDLMLLQLMSQQSDRTDFLIHDSGLYDGVDSRQRALAIELAGKITAATGTQYICTLNSDMIPREDFSEGFNFDAHVRLKLTDRNPSDSLLGFHFERPSK